MTIHEIHFLSVEDVIEIHIDQIEKYGGQIGIRDQNLLISAVAQPSMVFEEKYLHDSLRDKAAAYLYHLCQNHPFIDGNKRVSLVSMLVFLDVNGKSIEYPEASLEEITFEVSKGNMKKLEISDFLETSLLQTRL